LKADFASSGDILSTISGDTDSDLTSTFVTSISFHLESSSLILSDNSDETQAFSSNISNLSDNSCGIIIILIKI